MSAKTRTLGILLYEDFELLDVFGPAEMFAYVGDELELLTVAESAGPVRSAQRVSAVADYDLESCPHLDLLLVPGGIGTIPALSNETLLEWLRSSRGAQMPSGARAHCLLLRNRRGESWLRPGFRPGTSACLPWEWTVRAWRWRWSDDAPSGRPRRVVS